MFEEIIKIATMLHCTVFGGYVRDLIRGVEPNDIDVLSLDHNGFIATLVKNGFTVSPNVVSGTGYEYGLEGLLVTRLLVSKPWVNAGAQCGLDLVHATTRTQTADYDCNHLYLSGSEMGVMGPSPVSLIDVLKDIKEGNAKNRHGLSIQSSRNARMDELGYHIYPVPAVQVEGATLGDLFRSKLASLEKESGNVLIDRSWLGSMKINSIKSVRERFQIGGKTMTLKHAKDVVEGKVPMGVFKDTPRLREKLDEIKHLVKFNITPTNDDITTCTDIPRYTAYLMPHELCGVSKIQTIKAVRTAFYLGLKEAKDFCEFCWNDKVREDYISLGSFTDEQFQVFKKLYPQIPSMRVQFHSIRTTTIREVVKSATEDYDNRLR